jgi:hypothetical protein
MNFRKLMIGAALTGMAASPVFATPYCIAVNGGFGSPTTGESFVARNFTVPDPNGCTPWAGYTKSNSTVILIASGTACVSDDGSVMTVSTMNADPSFTGTTPLYDYLTVCLKSSCTISSSSIGSDGDFVGPAEVQTCTSKLEDLPVTHD